MPLRPEGPPDAKPCGCFFHVDGVTLAASVPAAGIVAAVIVHSSPAVAAAVMAAVAAGSS